MNKKIKETVLIFFFFPVLCSAYVEAATLYRVYVAYMYTNCFNTTCTFMHIHTFY